jgi:predicted HTH transcriptional regulator
MGTGIMRMRNAAKEANVAEPVFELNNFFKVTFKRPPVQAAVAALSDAQAMPGNDKNVSDNVQDKKEKNVQVKKSIVRQSRIVEILHDDVTITLDSLAELLRVSSKTIQRDLTKLRDQGRIERVGSDANGYWRIIES